MEERTEFTPQLAQVKLSFSGIVGTDCWAVRRSKTEVKSGKEGPASENKLEANNGLEVRKKKS